MIKLLEKIFVKMPMYDAQRDEILNCEMFSYGWFHEDRHRQQFQNKTIMFISRMIEIYCANLSVLFGLFFMFYTGDWRYFFRSIGLFMSPYVVMVLLLEIDAYTVGTLRWLNYKLQMNGERV